MPTAFVSHSDSSRHDTGWAHPEHQGRLPALVRAVYKDMLTLHGHLLQVEAVPATEADMRLVHTPGYLERLRAAVRAAEAGGQPVALPEGPVVSAASWEALTAATGAALTAVDTVLSGEARNAFASARPPGADAFADRGGGFSLVNHVAIAARHVRQRRGVGRVLVVEWAARPSAALAELLAGDPGIRLAPAAAAAQPADFAPDFVLLAAGFDALATDPVGGGTLQPRDYHALTAALVGHAERACGGRLVSVLEGGYDPPALGRAVVQHLRALAGLPPA